MISTHVLDTSRGLPASGVLVTLEIKSNEKVPHGEWKAIASEKTNADGRIVFSNPSDAGTYRLQFHTADYFVQLKAECFFPEVPVIFTIRDTSRKYHVPLLLNPYGYSTYRGS
jgi:5-hydroxyisourate hydrolase